MTYTFGSASSRLLHPTSSFTAVVQDVKDGLVDMGVGPYWVTGERLKMASFTVPIGESLKAQLQAYCSVIFLYFLFLMLTIFLASH